MPLNSNFENDVFISYAPIDNQPPISGQAGWISNLQGALKTRLGQLRGAELRISGNHGSKDASCSGDGVGSSAVLVSIVSPTYVNSESCQKEIKQFIHTAELNGGVSVDEKPRIFKVMKWPVLPENQPPEILSFRGYEFYQIDQVLGRPHELNPEVNSSIRQSYWLKLDDLAYDIHESLEKLDVRKDEQLPEASESADVDSDACHIFISYAAENESDANSICELLERQGLTCWFAARDAIPGPHYSLQITDALDKATAVVLVLSTFSNASVHVTNEVEYATSNEKAVYTVRIEDVPPSNRLKFFLAARHWLNAWVSPLEPKITRLADAIADEIGLHRDNESVFLAETTFDLKGERDGIRRELKQRGYNVLPDKSLPSDSEGFRRAVREYLERSRLSIHLIGANYGDLPKGANKSLVHLQNELAAERRGDPQFSSFIWIPPGLEPQDDKQRQFIERLQCDPVCDQQVELLRTSLEELKSLIDEALTNRRPPPPTTSSGGPLHIYLICDQQDRASVLPIRDHLYDLGYETVLPAMTGDEAQLREDHKENLVMCDACLIYYGAANEFWLRSKLRDLQKSAAYGRTSPMLAKAVYVAAPETPDKVNFRTLDAIVINNLDMFKGETLQPFLSKVSRVQTVRGGRQ